MRLGEDVPGVLTDAWKFVADDRAGIAEKVKDKDPESRLAFHVETRQLGIARWVRAEGLEGGCWLIALRARDPETEEPILNEPDDRVLTCMDKFDTWGRNHPSKLRAAAEKAMALREERLNKELGERTQEMMEAVSYSWKKHHGQSPVAVPKGVTI